jgi:hypothetical protein
MPVWDIVLASLNEARKLESNEEEIKGGFDGKLYFHGQARTRQHYFCQIVQQLALLGLKTAVV